MLIKFGSIVVNGRGKLGGHVYSKNRGGSYIRTLQTPSNPQTSFQQEGRGVFTQLTQDWSALTEKERKAWNDAVVDFPRTDIFGDTRQLSGKGLYISINRELLLINKAKVNNPPQKTTLSVPSELDVAIDLSGSTMTVTGQFGSGTAITDNMVLKATPKITAGTSNFKNKLVTLAVGLNIDDPAALFTAYQDRFGDIVDGDTIGFSIYEINDSGVRSPQVTTKTTVSFF